MSDAPAPEAASGEPAPVVATPRRRSGLWWAGLCVIGLALPSPAVAWFLIDPLTDGDGTLETMILLGTVSAAALAATVWVLVYSGWRRRTKAATLGAAAAGVALLFGLFRVEVDGAMQPTGLEYRFGESAEDRALAFAEENRVDAAGVAASNGDGEAVNVSVSDDDWPGLLGPGRDGDVPGVTLDADWERNPPRVVWRHPVGPGWGGFAVVGDRCFTLEQRGDEETIVCYRTEDGAELWATGYPARFVRIAANGGDGPASTPLFHEGKVYSFGATGVATCCDAMTGELLWKRALLDGANIDWGLACSPLIAGGNVVVLPGAAAGEGSAAVGLDPLTGETAWGSGDGPGSYSSPVAATLAGEQQLLAFEATGLRGLSLRGETLWSVPWTNQPRVNAAVPVVRGDRVFLSSGYGVGSAVYEIARAGDGFEPREVWATPNRFKLKFNDAVLHDGRLYGLDEGILSCVDFATGSRQWKRGRYGYGQCLLFGPETDAPALLVTTEDGDLVLVNPTPDRREAREVTRYSDATGEPLLDGICWNHAAFSRGRLFWRNGAEAVCVELPVIDSP